MTLDECIAQMEKNLALWHGAYSGEHWADCALVQLRKSKDEIAFYQRCFARCLVKIDALKLQLAEHEVAP